MSFSLVDSFGRVIYSGVQTYAAIKVIATDYRARNNLSFNSVRIVRVIDKQFYSPTAQPKASPSKRIKWYRTAKGLYKEWDE